MWREERETLSSKQDLKRFNEKLQREWAIETGIIEQLYSLDRGIAQLLIERGIDASLIPFEATDKPPALVAQIIEDHESAVDFLFDLVAQRRSLSVGFIKELHALMTQHQEATVGINQFGSKVVTPLERGTFKRWPNNPTRTHADGGLHEYCPPEHVDAEMDRLLELHLRHLEEDVPPEIEAAWLHHRFTQIHPFQDGNGRVARALASLVFISHEWFPLVITRDDRVQYLDALEKADKNGLDYLVELFVSRQRRAFVGSLGITREVTQEGERLDQQLAAIADLFSRRDVELRQELDRANEIARTVWSLSVERFEDLAGQLKQSMSAQGGNRNAFVDFAPDHDQRKTWHRWQIIKAARGLGYFAALR
ncbi:MAG: Fic family protein, partial [Pseudonocardiaceae bacterium]